MSVYYAKGQGKESVMAFLSGSSLAIYDWDGTLMDSHDYIIDCMLSAASDESLDAPSRKEVRGIIGLSMDNAIKALFPSLNDEAVAQFRGVYSYHYNDDARVKPVLFKEAKVLLDFFKAKGLVQAVATGKRRPGLDRDLEVSGSRGYFSSSRTADDCASKPSPEMVESILKELGVAKESAFVVGDNVLDISMAVAAKVVAIGVTTGSSTAEEMNQAGAILSIDSLEELIHLFES